MKPRIEALEHYQTYQQFRPLLEKAQECCPEFQRQIQDLRPEQPDQAPQSDFTLPQTFFHNFAACGKLMPQDGVQAAMPTLSEGWIEQYENTRADFWVGKYLALATDLQECCTQKVGGLQAAAARGEKLLEERDGLRKETARCQQITNEMARTLAELQQSFEQKKAGETQVLSDLRDDITLLRRQNDAHRANWLRAAEERDRLRAELTAAAPHPGAGLFAAFPSGEGSTALALCGTTVLLTGFLLGRSGHLVWWAKLASGTVMALISLCIYLGVVYLLPDTRPTDYLLALVAGLLSASLGALLHLRLSPFPRQNYEPGRRIRQQPPRPPPERQAAPAPPEAPVPREPGRRIRQQPPRPAPERRAALAPPERRESADEVVVDGYTLVPFDERDRQQPLFRCQGCERIYREASLQQMFRRTGGSCWQCRSRDIREYHLPP